MARKARCYNCDKEMDDRVGWCQECTDKLNTTITLPAENVRKPSVPAPRVGVHVAAKADGSSQRCARCGDLLKVGFSTEKYTVPGGPFYPEGALVERGKGWQAMKLSPGQPTCT